MWFPNLQLGFHKPKCSILKIWCPMVFITFILLIAQPPPLLGAVSLQFIIEAQESLEPLATHLKEINPQSLQRMMDFMGLEHPGPPIRVILAPNGSLLEQEAPEWMSGYALSHASTIVLLMPIVSQYP